MRTVRRTIIVTGLFLLLGSTAVADDYRFDKTEDGIFKVLTTPKKAVTRIQMRS